MKQRTKFQEATERLWSEVHGGDLADWISEQRRFNRSWQAIARAIEAEIELTLTDVTLANWYGDRAAA